MLDASGIEEIIHLYHVEAIFGFPFWSEIYKHMENECGTIQPDISNLQVPTLERVNPDEAGS